MAALSLQQLLQQGAVWQGQQQPRPAQQDFVDSGWPQLNQALGGGWLAGSVNELQLSQPFIGELALLLPLLRQQRLPTLWLNPPAEPYWPALQQHGLQQPPLWVRTSSLEHSVWVLEQAMQMRQCGVLLAWLQAPTAVAIRRLQQVAEQQQQLLFVFTVGIATEEARAYMNRLQLSRQQGLQVALKKRRYGWPLAAFPCPVDRLLPPRRRLLQ